MNTPADLEAKPLLDLDWLGTRVEAARTKAGLSVSDVADRTGIPVASVAALEGGWLFPTLGQLARLAAALGVSARELVTGH